MKNLNNNVNNEVIALDDEKLDKVNGGLLVTITAGTAAAIGLAALVKTTRDFIKFRKQKKEE